MPKKSLSKSVSPVAPKEDRERSLIDEIARVELKAKPLLDELSKLKRELRGIRASRASAQRRASRMMERDQKIRQEARRRSGDKYRRGGDALITGLAAEFGLTPRRIHQILNQDSKPS